MKPAKQTEKPKLDFIGQARVDAVAAIYHAINENYKITIMPLYEPKGEITVYPQVGMGTIERAISETVKRKLL